MHPALRFLCALAMALAAIPASAQTASTQATVKIENYALVITKQNDLDFGSITPSASASGYVTLDPAGTYSVHGSIPAYNPAGATPARYAVSGVPSTAFAVSLPGPTISLTNGTQSLLVGDFVAEGGPTQQLDGNGTANFRVGATVFIQAAQRPGAYTGSFNVTVAYN